MGDLSRIGVAIDTELLRRFDRFIAGKGYENRSEAFRDLIRERLGGLRRGCARRLRGGHGHAYL